MADEIRKFVAPEFVFGTGALGLCGRFARNFGARKVFLASDPGVHAAGWVGRVCASLGAEAVAWFLHEGISPNPRESEVREGARLYLANDCDVIVAVGGGSVLDAAKGIGIMVGNNRDILEFEGVDRIGRPIPPLICIPTTCGSSADVSQFAIITDTARQVKIAIVSKALVPDIALVDPSTLRTLDRTTFAAVTLDALTHACEAWVSNASSFMTDLHALQAIRLVGRHFPPAIAAWPMATDLDLSGLMQASLQAGLAFSNASLGLVHAMAHSLGGLVDAPHGECNGLLLPLVAEFNYPACPGRYDEIVRVLRTELSRQDPRPEHAGGAQGAAGQGAGAHPAVAGDVRSVLGELVAIAGLPPGIGRMGVRTVDLATLAAKAHDDVCLLTNPRDADTDQIRKLYESALA